MSSTDYLIAIIIFILGMSVVATVSYMLEISVKKALALYVWHSIFCGYYYYWATGSYLDANLYYDNALKGICDFKPGTGFISSINCVLVYFNFSFLSSFLFFNLFGALGLIIFYSCLKDVYREGGKLPRYLSLLFVFLPSLSMWTSSIGKDSLYFFGLSILVWTLLDFKRRKGFILIALFVLFFSRLYIAIIALVSITVAVVGTGRLKLGQKIVMGVIGVASIYFLLPVVLNALNLDISGGDISVLGEYIEQRRSYSFFGGSAIDISGMSVPVRMASYVFRPLPHEAFSLAALITSIDNTILLVSLLMLMLTLRKRYILQAFNRYRLLMIFSLTYSFGSWVVLSSVTGNLGTAVRQKWMFIPTLLIVGICILVERNVYNNKFGRNRSS